MKLTDTDAAVFEHESPQSSSTIAPGEIIIGSVIGLDPQGQPLVDFPENPFGHPLIAISTLAVLPQHVGREVALLFANGKPESPVVMGIIHSSLHELIATYDSTVVTPQESTAKPSSGALQNVLVDGKRVVIEGKEEIVLKCGDASITLTKAGKILIRGKYLLNRSSGVNRIVGGSVQVN